MFAKSLADLEVRSQLVWQNKGESSLQRAINSKEGGAAASECSMGPCPGLVSSAEGFLHSLRMLWTGWPRAWTMSLISLGAPGCWVIRGAWVGWEVSVTCTTQVPSFCRNKEVWL